MANVNSKFGFLAIGRDGGGPLAASQYSKVVAHAQALFVGDIVTKSAVSMVASDAGLPIPGCTSLQNGTPGTTVWLGANINYGAPATITSHFVFDTLDTVYIGQCDDTTSVTVADHVGKLAAFLTGTGNAVTKKSTMSIDASTINATEAGTDVRILRMHNRVGNAEGAYAILEVIINQHLKQQGGVGI